jgi:energy-coupling factor transporter ATP-binding protein EcfA2
VVAAGPRGVGKTTLLTALIACYPEASRRLYLRGCYETFAFLDDPTIDPAASVLLVNEISSHLPAYLWGPGVRRLFQAARQGFAFAATAHATSIEDLIGMLAGYPLGTSVAELATINLVVLMKPVSQDVRWRVDEVWAVARGSDRGLTVDRLADQSGLAELQPAAGPRPPFVPEGAETARRADFLAQLASQAGSVASDPARDMRAELARFGG